MRYFLILSSLILMASCGQNQQGLLIDSFEGKISKETIDYGIGPGSELLVTADKSLKDSGQQSLKVEFNLKESSYMWISRGYGLDVSGAACWLVNPDDIDWSKYNAVTFEFYGTGNGGLIAFDIKDVQGELLRTFIDDDVKGKKSVVFSFDEFFAREDWQPDTATLNGSIDFPIKVFQFEPKTLGKGVFNVDSVRLVWKEK